MFTVTKTLCNDSILLYKIEVVTVRYYVMNYVLFFVLFIFLNLCIWIFA